MFGDQYEDGFYEFYDEYDCYDGCFEFEDTDYYAAEEDTDQYSHLSLNESDDYFLDDFEEPFGWVPEDDCQ